jgi:predicted acyltransferase (DUF342 family)
MNQENEIMIKLPSQLFIEGNFKTYHSINIESNFTGILLSKNKVIIEPNSTFEGDIICSNLDLSGKIKGNIFCTGKVHAKQNCEVIGNIYTCRFENDETTDLQCLITVPKTMVVNKIKSILKDIDLNQKLSTDDSLPKIIEWFKKNQLSVEEKKELESSNLVSDRGTQSINESDQSEIIKENNTGIMNPERFISVKQKH